MDDDLGALTTDELLTRLMEAWDAHRRGIAVLAAHVAELDERAPEGWCESLPDGLVSLLPYLRQINSGKTVPEVVEAFGWKESLYRAVSSLPLSKQRELARKKRVPLMTFDAAGNPTHTMASLEKLLPDQLRQVFGRGVLRDLEGQRIYLEDQRTATMQRETVERQKQAQGVTIHVDREKNGVRHMGELIPLWQLLQCVDALTKKRRSG